MLPRRKKTRPWLKDKHDELEFLAHIIHVFRADESLERTFERLNALFMEHVHAVGSGLYLSDLVAERFSLRSFHDTTGIFQDYSELSADDIRLCGVHPAQFGLVPISAFQGESAERHPFVISCQAHAVLSLIHLPVLTHGDVYGIFMFLSPYQHQFTEQGMNFLSIAVQHIGLATEKILLTHQFEREVSLKVSQLQESEEKYRVLFEDASDAIVIVDFATQRFLDSNRQAETLIGYPKDDLLTMRVSELWSEQHEKRLTKHLLGAVEKRGSIDLQERQFFRKDGRVLWIELNASALEYRGKKVALAIIRDVTQRKQIELEKDVIDTINKALISSYDARNVYYKVCQTLAQVFAFERMDILFPGKTANTGRLFVSTHAEQRSGKSYEEEFSLANTPLDEVFRHGKPAIINYIEHKSSPPLPSVFGRRLTASLIFPLAYQEQIIGVLHFGRDQGGTFSPEDVDFVSRIAPQIAIAVQNTLLFQKVNEERAVYKHLIENVNEIVFQADPKGNILFVNHRVLDILGYTSEEIITTNFFSYVIPEDLEKAKAAFRLTLRHEQPLSGEYQVVHKTGSILTISIYTRPILEDGRPVGMHGIIQNITPPSERLRAHRNGLHALIGRSPNMQDIYELIMSVAKTDSTVLIHGESGTGKELIAQAIHASSHRQDKPFVVVNCAAYSENLLESELFGHERGAFTGAHRRKLGRFELAKGGTIFLDEIGEVPLHSQLLLLRVLQNRTFERVGGEKTLKTEVRIIAATNKHLEQEMSAGRFREDLYYRLNVIPIEVPPLRDRKDDIPILVEHFLKKYSTSIGKHVAKCTQQALDLLLQHEWFGNVRELENVVERAVVMTSAPMLTAEDLPAKLRKQADTLSQEFPCDTTLPSLYDHEKQLLLKALNTTQWNKYQTAKLLGITRSTLYSKIEKYQITPEDTSHAA